MTSPAARCLVGLATLIAITVALPRAAGAAPPARLVYARGPGAEVCPDEASLRAAVAARVGYDPFFPWAELTVTVEVTGEANRLRGHVVVIGEGGRERGAQEIDGAVGACDELIASVALAVSVALDGQVSASRPPPPAAPEEPPEPAPRLDLPAVPAPAPTKDAPAPSPASRPPPHPLALSLAPGARTSFGAWSAASMGPALGVELRSPRWGLAVEGRYEVTPSVAVGADAHAVLQRMAFALLPCAHFGWLLACGEGAAGETWARGSVAAPRTNGAAFVALGARTGVDVPLLPRLHVVGTIDVVGILTPTILSLDGGARIASNGPIEASAGIAVLVPIF